MYKTANEFEQGVVKLLNGILDGKFEHQDLVGAFNDNVEFWDVVEFANKNDFLLDFTVSLADIGYATNSLNPVRHSPGVQSLPRLSYRGLKFLEEHQNASH